MYFEFNENNIKFHFDNQTDVIMAIIENFNKTYFEAMWLSFIMAAKNSSLKQKLGAGAEYFEICLRDKNIPLSKFDFLMSYDSNYKTIIGEMLHNYTYLRNGLTLIIHINPIGSENRYEVYNCYEKIGCRKSFTRHMSLK